MEALMYAWIQWDLKKVILNEYYKAHTLNKISHELSGTKVFSILDAKNECWIIHLGESSALLTTFNTHKGRYRVLHMPFGLKMSQDTFQLRINQLTERLSSIVAMHDNICVFSKITPRAW